MGKRTHGYADTPTYNIWALMLQRCGNPKAANYTRYGGRGIRVCERWRKFDGFLADMGLCPAGLMLERKDNDKGYYPENCRWATPKEQAANRCNNRLITFNGETLLLGQWADRIGVTYKCLWMRLYSGWPLERALQCA